MKNMEAKRLCLDQLRLESLESMWEKEIDELRTGMMAFLDLRNIAKGTSLPP